MIDFMEFGPFDLPKKEKWVVVGSGPTGDLYKDFVAKNRDIGIFSVSMTLIGMEHADVNILSHYEPIWDTWPYLYKADIVFLPDPCHVGFRCVPIDLINLIDVKLANYRYGDKIRLFRKEIDMGKALNSQSFLYANGTISSAALHVLLRNGVKECYYCGIDGGNSRKRTADNKSIYDSNDDHYIDYTYDIAKNDFIDFAEKTGMKIKKLEKEAIYA